MVSEIRFQILDLIRAELDLPDEPSREQILGLLNEVLAIKRRVRSKRDRETLDKLHERVLAHFGPSMTTLVESRLFDELSAVGVEIAEINKQREALYLRAQELAIRASEEGLSNSLIARFLGVDRMTVAKYLTRLESYIDEQTGKVKTRKIPWTHDEFIERQNSRHRHPSRQAVDEVRRQLQDAVYDDMQAEEGVGGED